MVYRPVHAPKHNIDFKMHLVVLVDLVQGKQLLLSYSNCMHMVIQNYTLYNSPPHYVLSTILLYGVVYS